MLVWRFIGWDERAGIVDGTWGGTEEEGVEEQVSPEDAVAPENVVPAVVPVTAEQDTSDVLAELRELRECFDSKIRYDEVKERQIDALHEELQGFRQGLYRQIMQPVMNDLIGIYDEIADQLARPADGKTGGLDFLAEMVEEVLARYGVARYLVEGDVVDRSRQKVIGTQDTGDPGLSKLLARRVRPGFEMKGKVIRPEWVTAYRHVPDVGQEADG
jgi:molecular chaperone GrpE (heat shock protein)